MANVLRDLAHDPTNPTAVIASIHQPSSHLYLAFDSVLLLSEGRELYFGPGGSAPVDTLTAKGHPPCPAGYSIPDHLLNLASDSEVRSDSAIIGEPTEGASTSATALTGQTGGPSSATVRARMRKAPLAATFLTQFEVLCGREWKNLVRDKALFVTHVAVSIVLGVFCGMYNSVLSRFGIALTDGDIFRRSLLSGTTLRYVLSSCVILNSHLTKDWNNNCRVPISDWLFVLLGMHFSTNSQPSSI